MSDIARTPSLTSEEVARRVGINYRTLMRLVEDGILRPVRHRDRSRTPAVWSAEDLQEAQLIAALLSAGVKQKRLPGLLTLFFMARESRLYSGAVLFNAATDEQWRVWFLPGELMETLALAECRGEMQRRGATSFAIIPLEAQG